MGNEKISFQNVTVGYGKKKILCNLNFDICGRDLTGIVGPNGSGKTTILKTILGTLKPIEGNVVRKNPLFGYVPQRDTVQPLLPYTVYDVVMMGRYPLMRLFKNATKNDKQIVDRCLVSAGIEHIKKHNYNELSGGLKQRTLIARALAVEPNILILDEPTNGMDTPSHYSLLNLIKELHETRHLAVIIVSHLISDVANLVEKLMLIERENFQYGEIDDILSEYNLKKTYSSEFNVSKVNDHYLITSKKGNE